MSQPAVGTKRKRVQAESGDVGSSAKRHEQEEEKQPQAEQAEQQAAAEQQPPQQQPQQQQLPIVYRLHHDMLDCIFAYLRPLELKSACEVSQELRALAVNSKCARWCVALHSTGADKLGQLVSRPLLQRHVSTLSTTDGTALTGQQLNQLANLNQLQALWVNVTASAEPPLPFPPGLTSLTLNWTHDASPAVFTEAFNAAIMQGIAQLTRLHELNISVWRDIWTAHCSFDRLRGMPSLSSFGMAFYPTVNPDGVAEEFLTAEQITQLRKLTQLKRFAVTPLSATLRQRLLVKPAPGWDELVFFELTPPPAALIEFA
jgi:hypothetical protein